MAKRRNTPNLELTPELTEVRSRDFNMFYRPDREPLPAGLENFTRSLDNFVNGAGSSMAIAKEVKDKKINSAKAIQDYNENKLKFRDAVKSGKIDKTANPYYLEKYKLLSLNEYASEFNDRLIKAYGDNDVKNNINEGGFDDFYRNQLTKFIKEKNLGTFEALTLEEGFFKETSNYRASLEAQHKQTQLELFKKKFDEKLAIRVVGIVQKYKNYDANPTVDDKTTNSSDKFKLIANEINKETQSLIDVTGDGRTSIDLAFRGLEQYIFYATDLDFAKQLITEVPKYLVGGTDSADKIGRIKVKQEQLYTKLIAVQGEKEKQKNAFDKSRKEGQIISTYNFLIDQTANNSDFNIQAYLNDPKRTVTEKIAINRFIADDRIKPIATSDTGTLLEIDKLIRERKFLEAHELASSSYRNMKLSRKDRDDIFTKRIPQGRDFKTNEVFNSSRLVSNGIETLQKEVDDAQAGGSKFKALTAKNYIQDTLYLWVQSNQNLPKYKNNKSLFITDLEKRFIQAINDYKTIDDGTNSLFGKTGIAFKGTGSSTENIQKQIDKKKTTSKKLSSQQIADMKLDLNKLDNVAFESKHGMSKNEFRKKVGLIK